MNLLRATVLLFVIAAAAALVPAVLNKPTITDSRSAVIANCTETKEALAGLEKAMKEARAAVRERAPPGELPVRRSVPGSSPACRTGKGAVHAHFQEQSMSWKENSLINAIYVAQAFLLLIPIMIASWYLAFCIRSGKKTAYAKVILGNRRLTSASVLALFAFVFAGYIVPMLKASDAKAQFVSIHGFDARQSTLSAPFTISVDGYQPESGVGFHGSCTTNTRFFVLPWRLITASTRSFCPV